LFQASPGSGLVPTFGFSTKLEGDNQVVGWIIRQDEPLAGNLVNHWADSHVWFV
jgi:hypothetical protein